MIRTVVVEATRDRRAERPVPTRREILEAAWELCRAQGLAGLALRDVARKIGMQPPSLYWYFDSKQSIYDAMFAQGNRQLLERLTVQDWPADPRAILRSVARVFVEFARRTWSATSSFSNGRSPLSSHRPRRTGWQCRCSIRCGRAWR